MRATHVSIVNILGLTELELSPAAGVTIIEGENGAGKSSAVKAILSVTGGVPAKLLPTLLKKDADEGRSTIILSDNSEFTRYFERDEAGKVTTRLDGKYPNGRPMKEPAKAIRDLVDALCNPLYLLRDDVTPADRVRWLLEALPLKVTAEQLSELTGRPRSQFATAAEEHALVAIDRIYDELYNERRDANVLAIGKRKTVGELNEALPEQAEGAVDWSEEVGRLNREIGGLAESIAGAEAKANAMLSAQIAKHQAEGAAEATRIRDTANAAIARIREQAKADLAAEESRMAGLIGEAEGMAAAAVKSATAASAERKSQLASELATAEAARGEEGRIKSLRAMRDRALGEAEIWEARHQALQESMDRLNGLKGKLLADLPIPGVDIRGGDILLGGIEFGLLNTQKQVRLVVDIAMLRASKWGLICVDGLNDLDANKRLEFLANIADSGLQAICTDKSIEPLQARDLEGRNLIEPAPAKEEATAPRRPVTVMPRQPK